MTLEEGCLTLQRKSHRDVADLTQSPSQIKYADIKAHHILYAQLEDENPRWNIFACENGS